MTANGPAFPDERDLMRSLHEGSTAALESIYERTAPVLYPLALRIVGSRERAACVLEDLFEEIWRDRAQWRASAEIPRVAWIARCRELALSQVGVGAEPAREATLLDTPVEHGPAYPALAALSDRDRRALEEAYFCGTPAREIAARIGAPTTEVGILLRSALTRFRDNSDERTRATGGVVEAGAEVVAPAGSAS